MERRHPHILLYSDPETGQHSNTILTHQLDGQFSSSLLGLPLVSLPNRVDETNALDKELLYRPFLNGNSQRSNPASTHDLTGGNQSASDWPNTNAVLAATYAYQGDFSTAEEILRRMLANLVLSHQRTWDFPRAFDLGEAGQTIAGD